MSDDVNAAVDARFRAMIAPLAARVSALEAARVDPVPTPEPDPTPTPGPTPLPAPGPGDRAGHGDCAARRDVEACAGRRPERRADDDRSRGQGAGGAAAHQPDMGDAMDAAFFWVGGTYFARTNHQKTGGVGHRDSGR